MKFVLLFVSCGVFFFANAADTTTKTTTTTGKHAHMMMKHEDFKWAKGPEGLPLGNEIVVLDGDPSKKGMFTIRAKFPANYKIPPHTHPSVENVTVISGELMLGMGPKWDETTMTTLKPGGYASLPQAMAHYAYAKNGAEVQITAMGPFAIDYHNASDDPRKSNPKTLK